MLASSVIVMVSRLMTAQADLPESAAQRAERLLRQNDAVRFRPVGLCDTFLKLPEAQWKRDPGHLNILIRDCKKLGRDNLKLLRDLPNLREIDTGMDFPDGWCRELSRLTQLEGLFFGGNCVGGGNSGQGITDEGLACVTRLTNLRALSLAYTRVTDDGLRHLRGLTKLGWLSLDGADNITDKGLVLLQGLTELQQINMEGTKVTAAGLASLRGLTKLRELHLPDEYGPRGQSVGLAHLAAMTELRRLDARGLGVHDDDLRVVRKMTKLEELDLCYTEVTDAGLEHLAGLSELKYLDLFGTQVTGPGLRHLRRLKNLRELVLGLCPINDAAAEHLQGMTQLEYLEVSDTNMSKAAIEALRRKLPKTKVR